MMSSEEVYEKFLDFCSISLKGENPKFLDLIKSRYEGCDVDFRTSDKMVMLLERTQRDMSNEDTRKFVHLKDLLTELKINAQAKRKKLAKKRKHSTDSDTEIVHADKIHKLKDCSVVVESFPHCSVPLFDQNTNSAQRNDSAQSHVERTCSITDGNFDSASCIAVASDDQVENLKKDLGTSLIYHSGSPMCSLEAHSSGRQDSSDRNILTYCDSEISDSGTSSLHISYPSDVTKKKSHRRSVSIVGVDDIAEDGCIRTGTLIDTSNKCNILINGSSNDQESPISQIDGDKSQINDSRLKTSTAESPKKKSTYIVDVELSNSPDVLIIESSPFCKKRLKGFSSATGEYSQTLQLDCIGSSLSESVAITSEENPILETDSFHRVQTDTKSNNLSVLNATDTKEISSYVALEKLPFPQQLSVSNTVLPPNTAIVSSEKTVEQQDQTSNVNHSSVNYENKVIKELEVVRDVSAISNKEDTLTLKGAVNTKLSKRVPLLSSTKLDTSTGSKNSSVFSKSYSLDSKEKTTLEPKSSSTGCKAGSSLMEDKTLEAGVSADEFQEDNEHGKNHLKQQRRVVKLERLLGSLRSEIEKCQDTELSLDDLDDDNAAYIYEDKLKRKFVAVWNKLCEVTERSITTGRPTERTIRYSGTRYREINRRIQKFLNKKKVFPDFHDIKNIVKLTNKKCNLNLSSMMINDVSREAFVDIGEMLQTRRHQDFIATFGTRQTDSIRHSMDPYLVDPELRRKLDSNRQLAKLNLDTVIAKYTNLQYDRNFEEDNEKEEDEEEEEDDAVNRKAARKSIEEAEDSDEAVSKDVEDFVTTASIEVDMADEEDNDGTDYNSCGTSHKPTTNYNFTDFKLGRSTYLLTPDKNKSIPEMSISKHPITDHNEWKNKDFGSGGGFASVISTEDDECSRSHDNNVIIIDESPAKSQVELRELGSFTLSSNFNLPGKSREEHKSERKETNQDLKILKDVVQKRPNIKYTARKPFLHSSLVEDVNSRDCIVENVNSKDCVVENVHRKGCVAEDVSSKNCIAEDVNSKDCVAEDVSSRDCVAENVSSKDCVVGNVNSRHCVAEDVNSQDCFEIPENEVSKKVVSLVDLKMNAEDTNDDDDEEEEDDQSSDSSSEKDADDKSVDDDVEEIVMILNRSESECDTASSRDPSPISVVSLSSDSLSGSDDDMHVEITVATLRRNADNKQTISSPNKSSKQWKILSESDSLEKRLFLHSMGMQGTEIEVPSSISITDEILCTVEDEDNSVEGPITATKTNTTSSHMLTKSSSKVASEEQKQLTTEKDCYIAQGTCHSPQKKSSLVSHAIQLKETPADVEKISDDEVEIFESERFDFQLSTEGSKYSNKNKDCIQKVPENKIWSCEGSTLHNQNGNKKVLEGDSTNKDVSLSKETDVIEIESTSCVQSVSKDSVMTVTNNIEYNMLPKNLDLAGLSCNLQAVSTSKLNNVEIQDKCSESATLSFIDSSDSVDRDTSKISRISDNELISQSEIVKNTLKTDVQNFDTSSLITCQNTTESSCEKLSATSKEDTINLTTSVSIAHFSNKKNLHITDSSEPIRKSAKNRTENEIVIVLDDNSLDQSSAQDFSFHLQDSFTLHPSELPVCQEKSSSIKNPSTCNTEKDCKSQHIVDSSLNQNDSESEDSCKEIVDNEDICTAHADGGQSHNLFVSSEMDCVVIDQTEDIFKSDTVSIGNSIVTNLKLRQNESNELSSVSIVVNKEDFKTVNACSSQDFIKSSAEIGEPASHRESSPEIVKPASHIESSAEIVEPALHRESTAEIVEPVSHTENSAEIVKPVSHTESNLDIVELVSHIESSVDVIEPASHIESSPEVVVPASHRERSVEEVVELVSDIKIDKNLESTEENVMMLSDETNNFINFSLHVEPSGAKDITEQEVANRDEGCVTEETDETQVEEMKNNFIIDVHTVEEAEEMNWESNSQHSNENLSQDLFENSSVTQVDNKIRKVDDEEVSEPDIVKTSCMIIESDDDDSLFYDIVGDDRDGVLGNRASETTLTHDKMDGNFKRKETTGAEKHIFVKEDNTKSNANLVIINNVDNESLKQKNEMLVEDCNEMSCDEDGEVDLLSTVSDTSDEKCEIKIIHAGNTEVHNLDTEIEDRTCSSESDISSKKLGKQIEEGGSTNSHITSLVLSGSSMSNISEVVEAEDNGNVHSQDVTSLTEDSETVDYSGVIEVKLSNPVDDSANIVGEIVEEHKMTVDCNKKGVMTMNTSHVHSVDLINSEVSEVCIVDDEREKVVSVEKNTDGNDQAELTSLQDEDEIKIIEELSSVKGVRTSENSKADDRRIVDQLILDVGLNNPKSITVSPGSNATSASASEKSAECENVDTQTNSDELGSTIEKYLSEKKNCSSNTNSLCHSSVLNVECEEVSTPEDKQSPLSILVPQAPTSSLVNIQSKIKKSKRSHGKSVSITRKTGERDSEEKNEIISNSVIDVDMQSPSKKQKILKTDFITDILSSVLSEIPPGGKTNKISTLVAKNKSASINVEQSGDDDDVVVIMDDIKPNSISQSNKLASVNKTTCLASKAPNAFKKHASGNFSTSVGKPTSSTSSLHQHKKPTPTYIVQNALTSAFNSQVLSPTKRASVTSKYQSPSFVKGKDPRAPALLGSRTSIALPHGRINSSQLLPRLKPRVPIPSIQPTRISESSRTSLKHNTSSITTNSIPNGRLQVSAPAHINSSPRGRPDNRGRPYMPISSMSRNRSSTPLALSSDNSRGRSGTSPYNIGKFSSSPKQSFSSTQRSTERHKSHALVPSHNPERPSIQSSPRVSTARNSQHRTIDGMEIILGDSDEDGDLNKETSFGPRIVSVSSLSSNQNMLNTSHINSSKSANTTRPSNKKSKDVIVITD